MEEHTLSRLRVLKAEYGMRDADTVGRARDIFGSYIYADPENCELEWDEL